MECTNHNSPAKGLCLSCGKSLCSDCISYSTTGKIICSSECGIFLEKQELAINLLVEKSKGVSLASAYGAYLLGFIFIAFGFFSAISELKIFLLATGAGMVIMGIFYHINARKKSRPKN